VILDMFIEATKGVIKEDCAGCRCRFMRRGRRFRGLWAAMCSALAVCKMCIVEAVCPI
jgi:hypothetical protein